MDLFRNPDGESAFGIVDCCLRQNRQDTDGILIVWVRVVIGVGLSQLSQITGISDRCLCTGQHMIHCGIGSRCVGVVSLFSRQIVDDCWIGLVAVAGMSYDVWLIGYIETVGVLIGSVIAVLKVRPNQIYGNDLSAEWKIGIKP